MVPPPRMVPPPFMLKEPAINAVPRTLAVGRSRFSQRRPTRSSEALQSRLMAVSSSAMTRWLGPILRRASFRSARWKPPHSLCNAARAMTSTTSQANRAMTASHRLTFSCWNN